MGKLYSKVDLWNMFLAGMMLLASLINFQKGNIGDGILDLLLMIVFFGLIFMSNKKIKGGS